MNRIYVLSVVALLGCGDIKGLSSRDTASVRMYLTGADFTNTSIKVKGNRSVNADTRYRCDNTFDECFNLSGANPSVTVAGLCTSDNSPTGTWGFEYELYDANNCTGNILNTWDTATSTSPTNFACYDSKDLFSRASPNASTDANLKSGNNEKSVACLTINGVQNFSLTSCAVNSTSPLTMDCGCSKTNGVCGCSSLTEGTNGNLPSECTIAQTDCSIVCQ